MRITKGQLRRLIRESIQNPDDAMKAALKANDLAAFAKLLVDEAGQEAYLWLEDMKFEDPDFEDVRDLLKGPGVETAVYDEMSARKGASVKSSTSQKELSVLAFAFDATVSDEDLKHINFKPRKKAGQVDRIDLEDRDQQFGHQTTSLSAADAQKAGTTLQAVLDALEAGGASPMKRRR